MVYFLVIAHFLVLIIAYSGNSQKSGNKNIVINYLKPYLIGLNWDVELVPVEWNRVVPEEGCSRLVLKTDAGERFEALSSHSTKSDKQRERQLVGFMNLMALNADDNGLSSLIASAIRHAELTQNKTFSFVAIEQRQYGTSDYVPVYEARKVLVDDRITLMPILEEQRTVRSLVTTSVENESAATESVK
jgi:hypothetical protein